jgi:hypothetical protein
MRITTTRISPTKAWMTWGEVVLSRDYMVKKSLVRGKKIHMLAQTPAFTNSTKCS